MQDLFFPTGDPHLEDVRKRLANNPEQHSERDFTITGAQQHDLTRVTKAGLMPQGRSARFAFPDRRSAPKRCEEKTREEPRAAFQTRLQPYWCSAARLDEGHQAIPDVRVLVHVLVNVPFPVPAHRRGKERNMDRDTDKHKDIGNCLVALVKSCC